MDTRTGRGPRLRVAILASAIVLAGGIASTLALFTDTESVDANAFSTGSIDLTLTPATAVVTASTLMPGDTVNGSLVVANSGTAQLRYAMSTAATNLDGLGLAGQLSLTVRELGTNCAAFDGAILHSGALSTASIGSAAAGADAGDRTLAAGASETLCLRVALPLATGSAFQGAATTATFTFDAEQTANNP